MKIKKGDIVYLTSKLDGKVKHCLYCGVVKVPKLSNRLFYDLDMHKKHGFSFKNYFCCEIGYINLFDVSVKANKGIDKGSEYNNKWQQYFDNRNRRF